MTDDKAWEAHGALWRHNQFLDQLIGSNERPPRGLAGRLYALMMFF
jgi:hypothetical protein